MFAQLAFAMTSDAHDCHNSSLGSHDWSRLLINNHMSHEACPSGSSLA